MAKERFKRPKDEQELIEREAAGFWRAQALSKHIAESEERITIDSILRIHREFFKDAVPEIAGRFRGNGDDVKKLQCIEPPLGKVVEERMHAFWREMDNKVASLPRRSPRGESKSVRVKRREWNNSVIECATWVHHQITAIHPFCEGNGRMARIMNNVILRRFGLQPSDIRHLGDDKPRYLDALCQIDRAEDYLPLKRIVAEGMRTTYEHVFKIIRDRKNQSRSHKRTTN